MNSFPVFAGAIAPAPTAAVVSAPAAAFLAPAAMISNPAALVPAPAAVVQALSATEVPSPIAALVPATASASAVPWFLPPPWSPRLLPPPWFRSLWMRALPPALTHHGILLLGENLQKYLKSYVWTKLTPLTSPDLVTRPLSRFKRSATMCLRLDVRPTRKIKV